jgi:hypothetical protein
VTFWRDWLHAWLFRVPIEIEEPPPPIDLNLPPEHERQSLLDNMRMSISQRERVLRVLEAKARVISSAPKDYLEGR